MFKLKRTWCYWSCPSASPLKKNLYTITTKYVVLQAFYYHTHQLKYIDIVHNKHYHYEKCEAVKKYLGKHFYSEVHTRIFYMTL